MSTVIRPEISKSNPYYISKHRYYELKHFCLQYPEWKKQHQSLETKLTSSFSFSKSAGAPSDPVGNLVVSRLYFKDRMELIEKCCLSVANDLSGYLLKGVTEGLSYNKLSPPCCKEVYYDLYRKFFALLNTVRR